METQVSNEKEIKEYFVFAGKVDGKYRYAPFTSENPVIGDHLWTFAKKLFKYQFVGAIFPVTTEDSTVKYNSNSRVVYNENYKGDKGESMADLISRWKREESLEKLKLDQAAEFKVDRYNNFAELKKFYKLVHWTQKHKVIADLILWLEN